MFVCHHRSAVEPFWGSESVVFTQREWRGAHTHWPVKLQPCLWLKKICVGAEGGGVDNNKTGKRQMGGLTLSPLEQQSLPLVLGKLHCNTQRTYLKDFVCLLQTSGDC